MDLRELNRLSRLKPLIAAMEKELSGKYAADTVTGSMKAYPYIKHTVTVHGYVDREAAALAHTLAVYKREYQKLEDYITAIHDDLLRAAFRWRFIDGYSYVKIARKLGGNNTAGSVKKQIYRYIRENA